jgi:hypothetical protein
MHIILYHITKNSLIADLILCVFVCVCDIYRESKRACTVSFKTTLKLHFKFYNARKEKTSLSFFFRARVMFLLSSAMQGSTNTESRLLT